MKELIVLASTLLLSISSFALQPSTALSDVSSLKEKCKYEVYPSLLKTIVQSKATLNERFFSVEFDLKFKPLNRILEAKLSFACTVSGTKSDTLEKASTAREVIVSEDSGGRYGRIINWEKPFSGANWKGTIAHVNSVFGDGRSTRLPDLFLICPNRADFSCVSLEVKKRFKPTAKERVFVVDFLSKNIAITND